MGKRVELLQKMDLTAENRQSSGADYRGEKDREGFLKHLVETLDDVNAAQDQTERFYDILEQARHRDRRLRRAGPHRHS